MDFYILGYDELYKFLNLLGTVFSWVASDVHAKLEVARILPSFSPEKNMCGLIHPIQLCDSFLKASVRWTHLKK